MDSEPGIIKSILDTDLYKLTMQQAVCKLFPRVNVKYEFFNRGKTPFPKGFDKKLRKEIEKMANLRLTNDQKKWLRSKCGRYMDDVYIDFLSAYQFDPSEVGVILEENGELRIIVEGPWYRTILWEVPLMALVSELYFVETGETIKDKHERNKNNVEKGLFFHNHNMKVTDFGTRRRYSYDNQIELCKDLQSVYGSKNFFAGTSNVHIAMELGLTPIGTHAHEWFMFMAARYGYKMANHMALEHWVDVYQGDLGTALTDTYTTDIFLQSFDRKYSKLFDGPRHDSGEPTEWIDKFINHYKKMGINPSTKTAVFSNNLNKDEAWRIQDHCNKKGDGINVAFGIGTNFTNDVGVKPLNIVIKMVSAQAIPSSEEWVDTVKLSDDEGKHTGHGNSVELAKSVLGINKKELAII